MSLRERFEAWANKPLGYSLAPSHDPNWTYASDDTESVWLAYRAGYRLALEEAARECSMHHLTCPCLTCQIARVCSARIRALAEGLE